MTSDPFPSAFDRAREIAFVREVLSGNEAAIVRFEERIGCVPRILRALNGKRGRPLGDHDLCDLAQDTILVVLRKLEQFEAWVPIEGWIYRLCFLEFLNAVRRRGRQLQRNLELGDHVDADQASDLHAFDDLHVGLMQLGGVEAETIRMKHFDDLTFQEIGQRLEMPTNTAKTRYYRGLTKLRSMLQTYRHREDRHEVPPQL